IPLQVFSQFLDVMLILCSEPATIPLLLQPSVVIGDRCLVSGSRVRVVEVFRLPVSVLLPALAGRKPCEDQLDPSVLLFLMPASCHLRLPSNELATGAF